MICLENNCKAVTTAIPFGLKINKIDPIIPTSNIPAPQLRLVSFLLGTIRSIHHYVLSQIHGENARTILVSMYKQYKLVIIYMMNNYRFFFVSWIYALDSEKIEIIAIWITSVFITNFSTIQYMGKNYA